MKELSAEHSVFRVKLSQTFKSTYSLHLPNKSKEKETDEAGVTLRTQNRTVLKNKGSVSSEEQQ